MMAQIIYELERQELFSPRLDQSHPSYGMLECQARYSPNFVEPWLSEKLAEGDAEALGEAVASSRGPAVRYTLQTSQAADLFNGGVKTNALPEKISAVVNYRVALHMTPDQLRERAERIIRPIAASHNITLHIDFPGVANTADEFGGSGDRTLTLSPLMEALSPAPISPTDPLTSKTWARFSGVARSVFESHPNPLSTAESESSPTVVVTGDIMTGNTDTRFYWSLSENIYRWSPSRQGGAFNIHTVDERIRLDVHLEGIMLYYGKFFFFYQSRFYLSLTSFMSRSHPLL
jgi:Gly-Xaa carboxypeptidase